MTRKFGPLVPQVPRISAPGAIDTFPHLNVAGEEGFGTHADERRIVEGWEGAAGFDLCVAKDDFNGP